MKKLSTESRTNFVTAVSNPKIERCIGVAMMAPDHEGTVKMAVFSDGLNRGGVLRLLQMAITHLEAQDLPS